MKFSSILSKSKKYSQKTIIDFYLFIFVSILIFLIAAKFDIMEKIIAFTQSHEEMEIDEFLTLLIISSINLSLFAFRRWKDLRVENKMRLETEEKLNHLVDHDHLTGIPNRKKFYEVVEQEIIRANNSAHRFGVMLLDLDGFKRVNDIYGHRVGDEVLIEVSNRLGRIRGDGDLCARLGGDEYGILLRSIGCKDSVEAYAERVIDVLKKRVCVEKYDLDLGGSLGIVIADNRDSSVVEILRKADIAMYAAKKNASDIGWKFFDEEMESLLVEQQLLEKEMKIALKNRKFDIHFQPVFELDKSTIEYLEVLVRWPHTEFGFLPPSKFVNVAEECGMVFELGDYVLNEACKVSVTWGESVVMSINVSAHQVRHPNFIYWLSSTAEKHAFPLGKLEVEMTEELLVKDPHRATEVIDQLRTLGIKVALDDFGTGHSSLTYLQEFNFDRVILDRQFFSNREKNEKSRLVFESFMTLCTQLKINVVVKGIETEKQLEALRQFEGVCGQGFLLGRPGDRAHTLQLINESTD